MEGVERGSGRFGWSFRLFLECLELEGMYSAVLDFRFLGSLDNLFVPIFNKSNDDLLIE
jgi:hypothetical protein